MYCVNGAIHRVTLHQLLHFSRINAVCCFISVAMVISPTKNIPYAKSPKYDTFSTQNIPDEENLTYNTSHEYYEDRWTS